MLHRTLCRHDRLGFPSPLFCRPLGGLLFFLLLLALLAPLPRAQGAAKSARAYSNKWLVILGSSPQKGEVPAGLQKLRQQKKIPLAEARLSSTEFRGLMPCYEVVIAQAFSSKRKARRYSRRLRALKIDHYIKNAGRYVGRQPAIEAYCRSRKQKSAQQCGAMRWVETYKKQPFLYLPLPQALLQRLTHKARRPQPFRGMGRVWISYLGARQIASYRLGQGYTLYNTKQARGRSCKIKRFVLLTRGQPHFGYMQAFSKRGSRSRRKPTRPGCGSPTLFALLSCAANPPLPRNTFVPFVQIALPAASPAPGVYVEKSKQTQGALFASLKKRFLATKAYAQALQMAQKQARQKKQTLKKLYVLRIFQGKGRRFGLFHIQLQTGEGLQVCGREDVLVKRAALVQLNSKGKVLRLLQPLGPAFSGDVLGLIDLNRDNTPELLGRIYVNRYYIVQIPQMKKLCGLTYPFCDCPC